MLQASFEIPTILLQANFCPHKDFRLEGGIVLNSAIPAAFVFLQFVWKNKVSSHGNKYQLYSFIFVLQAEACLTLESELKIYFLK